MSACDASDRAAERVAVSRKPAWAFRILVEIANFEALRRRLGRARADLLVDDLAARLASVIDGAWAVAAGPRILEIDVVGDDAGALSGHLAAIRAACAAPFDLDGEPTAIEITLGAAKAPRVLADDVCMTEQAEAALAEARASHGSVTRDLARAADGEALVRDLERALEAGELFLQYQPKVHVRRQEIGSIEALIRWQHPTRGLVLPGDFIPAAEASRLIAPLTLWTIRQAIDDQRALAARGHDLRVFVNIAGVLLGDAGFVRDACALVAENDAPLGFEITETSVIRDPQSAIANLQVFADAGITVAIDDYGAGLSSLAYLKQLPARELKIDKLFVTQLSSSNRDPLIVRSTIDLAHALEMEVVAEGVESATAMALLTVMGCDMVQGFLISRPLGFDALVRFLDEDRARPLIDDRRPLAAAWRRG